MRKKKASSLGMRKQLALTPGYICLIVWFAFTFVMVGWVVLASFSTTKEIFNGEMFRFESGFHPENYVTALVTNNVAEYFFNSLIYTVFACGIVTFVAAPASYALARIPFRGNRLLLNMFVVGMSIPVVMIIIPLYSSIYRMGLTNSRGMLIFLYICLQTPFTVFFLYSFFQSLPTGFEEAAAIDGCTPVKAFWKIMFPLAQPGIVTALIFNVITIWNEYFLAYIMIDNASMKPVAVGLYTMIQSMRYSGDWAAMFAAVVTVFLPTFLLYLFVSDKIIAGITGGGIKG